MKLLYKNSSLISEKELMSTARGLDSYLDYLRKVSSDTKYSYNESSINLPFDEQLVKNVLEIKEKYAKKDLKYFVLVGIGGSSLGVKAVHDALGQKSTELILLNTIQEIPDLKFDSVDEVLVTVVSKSGITFETTINLENFLFKYPELEGRVVCISSQKTRTPLLEIPEKVGGRFSVLSAAGLFPFACLGYDLFALLEGAMEARKYCLGKDPLDNFAVISAVLTYLHYKKDKKIKVNFMFHPQLESLGKWYQQLLAESLGKDGKGVTPITSVGTNDLHSMLQLYLEGPHDKFTEFVYPISGLSQEVFSILDGVKNSYNIRSLPYIDAVLDNIDERSLGHYMQCKMVEVMLLGKLLGVHTFDQPAVEEYKEFARKNPK